MSMSQFNYFYSEVIKITLDWNSGHFTRLKVTKARKELSGKKSCGEAHLDFGNI